MKKFWLAAAFLLSTTANLCLAGPPFVTDDPEPVEFQHWEFYLATMSSKYGHDLSGSAALLELNYGAVPDLQLHLIAPLAYDVSPTGSTIFGVGDLELGAKYRFINEDDKSWVPQVGTFPLIEVPTGSLREGLGNGHLEGFVPIWLQKSWGEWTAYGGYGYGINSIHGGPSNWQYAGAVITKELVKGVTLGAEFYHQTHYQFDFPNKGTAFNVGLILDVTEQHHLLFSAGRSIDGPINFQFYAAYQFTFDNSFFGFVKH